MHQPYTAPTLNFDETSDRFTHISAPSSHHKPIHQRHSPPNLRANPATTNQSTNDTVHTYHTPQIHTPIQPPHPHSLHKNTRPLDASPPTDADVDVDAVAPRSDAIPRRCCSTDAVAAPMHSQPRTSPQLDRPDRQDQIEPDKTGLDQKQIRPD